MDSGVFDHLKALIRIPSINPMGRTDDSPTYGESRVGDYLISWARANGFKPRIDEVVPGRRNVVVEWAAPSPKKSILLEVHQDTVPVEGMIIDPFGGERRDGRIWGRGACDVKGSMAVVLGLLEWLRHHPAPPAVRVVAAFTIDEEHTFFGVQHLTRNLPPIDAAIVFEPTCLHIVDAHKGVARFAVETRGVACHSSRPQDGVNAIERMAEVVTQLARHHRDLAERIDGRLGPPTLNIGTISGGVSPNTVPDRCRVELDRRLVPGETAEGSRQEIVALVGAEDVEVGPLTFACPALAPHPELGPLKQSLGASIDSVLGSHRVVAVPYGTDASSLAEAGVPCVVFGPGDIAQAHTKDEWIAETELVAAGAILRDFLVRWGQ